MSSHPAEMNAQVLHSADELRLLLPEWKQLFLRCPEATPFQHPHWIRCWIDAFTPRDLIGIEIRDAGRLVGFAPLLIYPREEGRILAFAGGGVSDYMDVLLEPGREVQAIEQILSAAQSIPGWDVLDFTDLARTSRLLTYEPLAHSQQEHDVCFVLALPESQDQLLHTFSKRQRANLRNARSRTQREGEARIELAESSTLPEFLDDLFRLHALRWSDAGESGVLHDQRVQRFHRAVAPHLLADDILRLYRMRVQEKSIAAIYSLFYRGTVFCYLQGFDPEFSHLSPGTQLMFAVIQDAVRLGMRRFDFLRGEEAYKMHWRPGGECTSRVEVPRAALLSPSIDSAA